MTRPNLAAAVFTATGLFAVVALTGCASPTPAPASATPAAPSAGPVATLVQADLALAIQEANGATPPDTQGAQCYTYLLTNFNALTGSFGSVKQPVGVISAFEAVNIGLNGGAAALGTSAKTALENACGPLVLHAQNTALTISSEVVALLGGLGIKVALPAAGVLP